MVWAPGMWTTGEDYVNIIEPLSKALTLSQWAMTPLRHDSEQLHTEVSHIFKKERMNVLFYLKQVCSSQLFF